MVRATIPAGHKRRFFTANYPEEVVHLLDQRIAPLHLYGLPHEPLVPATRPLVAPSALATGVPTQASGP